MGLACLRAFGKYCGPPGITILRNAWRRAPSQLIACSVSSVLLSGLSSFGCQLWCEMFLFKIFSRISISFRFASLLLAKRTHHNDVLNGSSCRVYFGRDLGLDVFVCIPVFFSARNSPHSFSHWPSFFFQCCKFSFSPFFSVLNLFSPQCCKQPFCPC